MHTPSQQEHVVSRCSTGYVRLSTIVLVYSEAGCNDRPHTDVGNPYYTIAMADGMLPMLGLSSADGNHGGHFGHVVYTPADGNTLVGFDSDPARESVENHLLDTIPIQKYTRPLQGGLSGSDPLADFHNPPLAGLDRPGPIGDQSSQNGDSLPIPVFDPKGSLIGPHHGPTLNLSRLGLHHDQSCTSVHNLDCYQQSAQTIHIKLRDAKTTGLVPVPGHVYRRSVVRQIHLVLGLNQLSMPMIVATALLEHQQPSEPPQANSSSYSGYLTHPGPNVSAGQASPSKISPVNHTSTVFRRTNMHLTSHLIMIVPHGKLKECQMLTTGQYTPIVHQNWSIDCRRYMKFGDKKPDEIDQPSLLIRPLEYIAQPFRPSQARMRCQSGSPEALTLATSNGRSFVIDLMDNNLLPALDYAFAILDADKASLSPIPSDGSYSVSSHQTSNSSASMPHTRSSPTFSSASVGILMRSTPPHYIFVPTPLNSTELSHLPSLTRFIQERVKALDSWRQVTLDPNELSRALTPQIQRTHWFGGQEGQPMSLPA
ncbi:hypothetical protein BU17DRAFT_88159 [Hysterangium stoloniferum]|nr:hypothetical protein BU17DRAFT_88159 [Hysterangium stoloniferum]